MTDTTGHGPPYVNKADFIGLSEDEACDLARRAGYTDIRAIRRGQGRLGLSMNPGRMVLWMSEDGTVEDIRTG